MFYFMFFFLNSFMKPSDFPFEFYDFSLQFCPKEFVFIQFIRSRSWYCICHYIKATSVKVKLTHFFTDISDRYIDTLRRNVPPQCDSKYENYSYHFNNGFKLSTLILNLYNDWYWPKLTQLLFYLLKFWNFRSNFQVNYSECGALSRQIFTHSYFLSLNIKYFIFQFNA